MLDKNTIQSNTIDIDGNLTSGGYVRGLGLSIDWQDGPLRTGDMPLAPTGAFVETVIEAARQRLEFYQTTTGCFKCQENAIAIMKLEEALLWLNKRTQDREKRGVEGTHTP